MSARPGGQPFPNYASTLIGREAEIELVEALIADPEVRLITITGIAGIGKTRLASYLVREFDSSYSLFIPLATVNDPALVLPEIGRALGVQGDDLTDAIRHQLENRSGIVVLDNLEQAIEAASEIAGLLPHNPDLTIITTSQRPLDIEGERIVRLAPFNVPDAEAALADVQSNPSVQLLVDRASSQDESLIAAMELEPTARAVAEICRKLDGIPLALELAASRLASLSPEVVLLQLEHGQQILSSTRRDTPERHRTMQSAIGWSVDLLSENARRTFTWLGAFTAGFDLNIIERVSVHLNNEMDAIDTVSELMQLNLISRVSGGANPWYAMLATIREYCLGELEATDERSEAQAFVAEHIVAIADQSESILTGPDSAEWILTLDRELPTIRAAVAWALAHADANVTMRVATGIWRYFEQVGRWQEVVSWIDRAYEWRETLPDDVLIAGMITKMMMQEEGRDIPGAVATERVIEGLLEGKQLPELHVQFLLRSGSLAQDQQKLDEANQRFHEALKLAEAHNVGRNATVARGNIGIIAYLRGDHATAEDYFLQVRADLETIGDKTGLAIMLSNLAVSATFQNKPSQALQYLEESIVISEELGLRGSLTYARINQCTAYIALGDLDAAADAAHEAIDLARDLAYPMLESTGFVNLAEISLLKSDLTAAGTELLRALELVTPDEGSRTYVEVGLLVADALTQSNHWEDAAAILAKSLEFAEEVEFSFEWGTTARIERVSDQIHKQLENPHQEQDRGTAWTTDEWVNKLKQFARRLAVRSQYLLVTIPEQKTLAALTPRENAILQLLLEGNSTKDMSQHLSVSPRTVTTHIGNIMGKLEVSSRAELVAKVLQDRNNHQQKSV